MKTFQVLEPDEAIARLTNFLGMNFKFTVQEISDKLTCFRLTHGEERLTDLAYYIQYALIDNVDYIQIIQTVYHDFMLYNKQDTPFRTFCFTYFYNTRLTMAKYPKRINVVDLDNLSPINEDFDNVEVHPCREVGHDAIEQCEPGEEEFWSVYVHLVAGGLCCVADFMTSEEAETFRIFLVSVMDHSKQRGR